MKTKPAVKGKVQPKDEKVNITQIYPIALPNQMGGVSITMWGLGDDSQIYTWESADHSWKLS